MMIMVVRKLDACLTALAATAALALVTHPSEAGASAIPAAPGGANGAIDPISCASAGNSHSSPRAWHPRTQAPLDPVHDRGEFPPGGELTALFRG